jgi:hypothetical protein
LIEYVPPPESPLALNSRQIISLRAYYKPSRGRLTSWWQRGKAEARDKLLAILNEEQVKAIEQGAMLEQAIRNGRKNEIDFKVFAAQNAEVLLSIQHKAQLIEQAMDSGLSLELDQQVRVDSLMVEAEVSKHEQMTRIELEKRWTQIKQDMDAADLYETSEQSVINKLTGYLREMLLAKHEIETGKDPLPVKKRIIAQYDRNIESLEARINERNGLVLPKNKEEARRPREATPNSREDSREAHQGFEESVPSPHPRDRD